MTGGGVPFGGTGCYCFTKSQEVRRERKEGDGASKGSSKVTKVPFTKLACLPTLQAVMKPSAQGPKMQATMGRFAGDTLHHGGRWLHSGGEAKV